MRDRHYEANDYSLIKERIDYAYSLFESCNDNAFEYVYNNLAKFLGGFNPEIGVRISKIFKQIKKDTEGKEKEEAYKIAMEKFNVIFTEYFRHIAVDISEHYGNQ